MKRSEEEECAERFRLTCALGCEIMRQNLRRRHPDLGPEELQSRFLQWLHDRPEAEHGDAPGRVVGWPRRR